MYPSIVSFVNTSNISIHSCFFLPTQLLFCLSFTEHVPFKHKVFTITYYPFTVWLYLGVFNHLPRQKAVGYFHLLLLLFAITLLTTIVHVLYIYTSQRDEFLEVVCKIKGQGICICRECCCTQKFLLSCLQ